MKRRSHDPGDLLLANEDVLVLLYNDFCKHGHPETVICSADIRYGPPRDLAMQVEGEIDIVNFEQRSRANGRLPTSVFGIRPDVLCRAICFDRETTRSFKRPGKRQFCALALWMNGGQVCWSVKLIRKKSQTSEHQSRLIAQATFPARFAVDETVCIRPHEITRFHLGEEAAAAILDAHAVVAQAVSRTGCPSHYWVELTPPLAIFRGEEPIECIVGVTESELVPQQNQVEYRTPRPFRNVFLWPSTQNKDRDAIQKLVDNKIRVIRT